MAYVNYETPVKLIEGWLQHKCAQETKWTQYWCVLKDYVIYIFKTQETSRDNHIGVLSIGSDTTVKIGESDPKKGYRFDLYTTKKLNKFKTTKFIERELWKAYIVGLAEGDISENFDLLQEQIQKVRNDVHRVMSRSTKPPLPITPHRPYMDNTSIGTGFQSPDGSIDSNFDKKSQTSMDNGGPTIRHRFWLNPDKTEVPSWFFISITRDTAENILTTGRNYGNTLMRESVTFRDTGSYVISKKMEHSRGPPFNHFEVIRVADGFKINVENAHKSMKCLSDVMDHFVNMSGSVVTRPMVTNDIKVLGLDTPDYDTKIWKSKTNAESGEEDIDADYPTESFDEPVPNPPFRDASSHKTWGHASRHARDSRQGTRGGVTMGVGPGSRSRVTSENMHHRVMAANVMSHLDSTLDRFSSDSHNTSKQAHHSPGRQHSNENEIRRRGSQPTMESPYPEAAATLPRWQSRAKSVPNLQIPQYLQQLNQEVPVSQKGPGIVKIAKVPPRVLPKRPKQQDDSGEGQGMSALQQQLQTVRLRSTEKDRKPSVQNRNTWHQRQQLPTRSYSTSAALEEDIYQAVDETALTPANQRPYSESDTTDEYYDDAVGLPLTEVTFDLGASYPGARSAMDPSNDVTDNSGGMKKEDFKKKLESLMSSGGGLMVKNPLSPSIPPPSLQAARPQEEEEEEEEYDEIIYESPD